MRFEGLNGLNEIEKNIKIPNYFDHLTHLTLNLM